MKKYTIGLVVILLVGVYFVKILAQDQKPATPPISQGQTPFLTPEEKRELRKNLVVKEMNTDAKGKRKWMDHLTVWNEYGLKLEEIEYAVYGQKERVTFEYDETGKCIRENVYNDKNKLYRIRKYEYLPNGRKKIQYNYNPDGKLFSTKVYEYTYR
jgi:antitoxin component YwqK of YwqJK toxin-antitoxin module